MICGTLSEVQALFCVLAQYGVRPDRYICPGHDLLDMYGTPCPDDGESRCYIRFSTDKDVEAGPGAEFLYFPYGSEEQDGVPLLLSRRFSPKLGPKSVRVPKDASSIGDIPGAGVVDTRVMNEAGVYVGCNPRRSLKAIRIREIEVEHIAGKAMYEKMSRMGGRFMIASHYPMGDNYRWMARFEGLDYSDVTFVVSEKAKELPRMLGVEGMIIGYWEQKCIRQYLSMSYYEDPRFRIIPFSPLYPGIMVNSDIDVSLPIGVSRRVMDATLLMMEPADEDMKMRRVRAKVPSMILLNPYGISMANRSDKERRNSMETMRGLAEAFLERGCVVYTNTPFEDQQELPGTKRYEGDMIATMAAAPGFDLVVSVFTGFMEAMIHTDCNLVVLSYTEKDTRKPFARNMGHDNYWELNVVDNDPEDLVSRISDIYDGICGRKKPCRPVEHVLSMEEAASLFGVQDMGPLMLDFLLSFGTPEEMRRLLSDGTEDPVLCCVGGRALETGVLTKMDMNRAIRWYRKARKLGNAPVVGLITELKKQIEE